MVFKNGIVCYLIPNFFNSGVSLGDYIILDNHGVVNSDTVYHEYGHSIQSRYLGPVYLIVIGLPSLIGNIWDRVAHTKWSIAQRVKWYYNQPWEKGADKLGGVNRFD